MLRFYQRDCVDAALFGWSEYRSLLLTLGTSAGKTIIVASLIKAVRPARCLVIGDQLELISQPAAAISKWAGIIPAIDQGQNHASLNAGVVVASAQTLARKDRLERYPRNFFDYVFCDEAHRRVDATAEILRYFENAKVAAVTATPFRAEVADLSAYYEHVAYSLPMIDLMELGFAPPWNVLTLPIEIDLGGVGTSLTSDGKEYDKEEVSHRVEPFLQKIAESYVERCKSRHTIAFLPLKVTAEKFASICRGAGIRADYIAGDSPDRDEKLHRFAEGEIELLANSNLLGTGVDLPIADCFLNISPTRSLVQYNQRAGRIARVLPGVIDDLPEEGQAAERKARIAASAKKDCLILDVLWDHDKLGVAHPGHLVTTNKDDADAVAEKTRKLRNPYDLLEVSRRVVAEREAKLRKALEEAAAKAKRKLVDATQIGMLLNDPYIEQYHPISRWELEPPTERQLEYLKRHRVDPDTVTSKGIAKKLCDTLHFRGRFRLATPVQLRLLKRLHVPVEHPEKLTQVLAVRVLDTEFKRRKLEAKRESEQKKQQAAQAVAAQDWP